MDYGIVKSFQLLQLLSLWIHGVVEPMQHLCSGLVAFTCLQVAIVIQSGNVEYPVCKRKSADGSFWWRVSTISIAWWAFIYMEPRIDTRQIGHWAARWLCFREPQHQSRGEGWGEGRGKRLNLCSSIFLHKSMGYNARGLLMRQAIHHLS